MKPLLIDMNDYVRTGEGANGASYNHKTDSFDQPVDKIVYSLISFDNVNNVTSYHREGSSSQFQLVSEMQVIDLPVLFAKK